MAGDNQKMIDNFNNMPIEELENIVNNKSDDYNKDAIKVAYRILKERGVAVAKPKPKIKIEDSTREVHPKDLIEGGGNGILKKISGYFQFKNMITTSIIKTLYVFGVIGIIMYSIELINESSGYGANEDLKLYGFALLIFGNLFWRLICEGWILFFSIHESLVSIENNTKK